MTHSNGQPVDCQGKDPVSTTITCQLALKAVSPVEVTVKGAQGYQQQFVIMYNKVEACAAYSLNLPLYK